MMVTEPEIQTGDTWSREFLLGEINDILDMEMISPEQLLGELLMSMETPEIRENWEFIKRNHEFDQWLNPEGADE
jgi:hypothetical protein